ncbi:glycoside hydrolase family 140 protein [Spirosoma foliorum]|uniref:Glycoside hydrolase family 140 protein n=1 Tax=Spirosoma foliorum TaxID=2710596 RepID=A0A7G5GTF3_9BACT|nr:glycoside hydrolase family 140 protein [Spirosoma foliorum]QMW02145.1 glycoside hydrolase family 140 protein [Spirosoma foliorum]
MRKIVPIIALLLTVLDVLAQGAFKSGPLKVSDNHRYLVHQDGTPFFYMGDTAWELFHRLNREEADRYLKRRAEQGFTVIQAVGLAEFDGLNVPNALGDKPLLNNDPTTPNEAYFKHVDYIIDKAAENNLVIGFLPTWGDKVFKSSWGNGPEVFNPKNARTYGQWLGNRYKNRQNIIWILGGDRTPRDGSDDVAIWRAMAEGIEAGVGGSDKALMTFHPQPNSVQDGGSSKWFHQDSWLDFNMHQNGHCRDTPIYDKITVSYNRTPAKPTMDAEPIYEDHPVCFNVKDLGTSNAYDVRIYAYLDLFAGAHGHTYGCHDIWQMYSPNRPAVNGPHIYWQEALELPGANQMKIVRRLMESRPLLDRIPDQSLIVENNYAPAERIQATRGKDYAFIYTTAGKPFTVNLDKISGQTLKNAWLNPRTGEVKENSTIANKGQQKFTPPSAGYGQDWVLVLDDAAKNYPAP